MAYRSKRGIGDVGGAVASLVGAGVEAGTPSVNADYPGYCSWMLFADYMPACQVPTAAVQNAAVKQQIVAASGGDAELADAQYQAYMGDIAALARIDPEGAAQYKFAGENPNQAALLGAGPFGRIVGGTVNAAGSVSDWLGVPAWVWLAGVGAFALVAVGGGSPRRYGR